MGSRLAAPEIWELASWNLCVFLFWTSERQTHRSGGSWSWHQKIYKLWLAPYRANFSEWPWTI